MFFLQDLFNNYSTFTTSELYNHGKLLKFSKPQSALLNNEGCFTYGSSLGHYEE